MISRQMKGVVPCVKQYAFFIAQHSRQLIQYDAGNFAFP